MVVIEEGSQEAEQEQCQQQQQPQQQVQEQLQKAAAASAEADQQVASEEAVGEQPGLTGDIQGCSFGECAGQQPAGSEGGDEQQQQQQQQQQPSLAMAQAVNASPLTQPPEARVDIWVSSSSSQQSSSGTSSPLLEQIEQPRQASAKKIRKGVGRSVQLSISLEAVAAYGEAKHGVWDRRAALNSKHAQGFTATGPEGSAGASKGLPVTSSLEWAFSPLSSVRIVSATPSDAKAEALAPPGYFRVQDQQAMLVEQWQQQQQQGVAEEYGQEEVAYRARASLFPTQNKQVFQEEPCFSWEEPCVPGPKASQIRWRCNQLSTMDLGLDQLREFENELSPQTQQLEHAAGAGTCSSTAEAGNGQKGLPSNDDTSSSSSSKRGAADGAHCNNRSRGHLKKLCRGNGGLGAEAEGLGVQASAPFASEGLLGVGLDRDELLAELEQARQRQAELEEKLHEQQRQNSM